MRISITSHGIGDRGPNRSIAFRNVLLLLLLCWPSLVSSEAVVRRWRGRQCRAMEAAEPGSRAVLAPLVFEGKARSKSDVLGLGGLYRVTFDVVTVLKGSQLAPAADYTWQVRLQFLKPMTSSTANSTVLSRKQKSKKSEKRRCVTAADVKPGRRYLVFAESWGPNNFTAVGAPLVHSKRALKDVRSVLCHRCGQSQPFFFIFF